MTVAMAAIGFVLAEARGWKGEQHTRDQLDDALAIMGRYGKQCMVTLEREIPARQLFEWVRAMDRLIERENERNRK
jgi:hypothetical protein